MNPVERRGYVSTKEDPSRVGTVCQINQHQGQLRVLVNWGKDVRSWEYGAELRGVSPLVALAMQAPDE